jgi:UDP-N-acetylmuramate--alanine ligase
MATWLLKQLKVKVSYSVGAQISFGDMGSYVPGSEYFVYECDEFDRNFLAFHPFFSIISGVSWDHHEIFPTQADYNQAFSDFLGQSQRAILWQEDAKKLGLDNTDEKYSLGDYDDPGIDKIKLPGLYNRRDAWLVVKAVSQIVGPRPEELYELMNSFPGVARRFEMLAENLYSDDAHTPEKIIGGMSVAKEMATENQKIIVLYEPLTNRRMHYLAKNHHSVFEGASEIYWLPSYLAREDPNLPILTPDELIKNLNPGLQKVAHPALRNDELKQIVDKHLDNGDLVVAMTGGGGDSLDEWLRKNFQPSN